MIPAESVGVNVPYAYGADCLQRDAVSKASLIGTVFKFTADFENSFAFNPVAVNTGSAQEGFKNHSKILKSTLKNILF